MSPRALFRTVAIVEATTWALLLFGMFLKYVTRTTDAAVSVFGMLHGIAFIAYCLVTVLVWTNQRWNFTRGLVGLLCAVPPFATIFFDRAMEKRGALAGGWRFRDTNERPKTLSEKGLAWLVRRPSAALIVGLAAVAVLTVAALIMGPPVSLDN